MSIPLYGAAAAAWCVDTPAGFVAKIFDTADYQNIALVRARGHRRCVIVIFVRVPGFARDCAINYLVAWVYLRAGARVAPVVLCKHSFLHGLLSCTDSGEITRAWPPHGHALTI
jgi:hypothetical protein